MNVGFSESSKIFRLFFRRFRAVRRAVGDGGPLQAVAAPLTPRPRGTIMKLSLLTVNVFEKSPRKNAVRTVTCHH